MVGGEESSAGEVGEKTDDKGEAKTEEGGGGTTRAGGEGGSQVSQRSMPRLESWKINIPKIHYHQMV